MGGCGWGPVVSVDEEYEEHFQIEDVAPLLERLRSTSRPSESHA
jgi:NADH:ubiquinone oxidoreductase subunit E